ncbi:MAG: hypothetical protein ACTHZ6_15735 [Brevibacterium aurantiacum]|uniref:hypothetical protein n=1 Tax=Brevibacterium aurantiacum TaxID=273384 RepID=UPI003F9157BC
MCTAVGRWLTRMPRRRGRALWSHTGATLGLAVVGAVIVGAIGSIAAGALALYVLAIPAAAYVGLIHFWPAVRTDIAATRRHREAVEAEDSAVASAREILEGGRSDEQ